MEDISRELEREIAQSKPKPYIQDRRTRVIIVDDFGEMKSGDYLKALVKFFSLMGVICFIAAVVFYYLYADLSKDSSSIQTKLAIAQEKVNKLTQEKEVLMAKLVISGQKLDIAPKPAVERKQNLKSATAAPPESEYIKNKKTSAKVEKKEDKVEPESDKIVKSSESDPLTKSTKIVNKTVTIENFIVEKSRTDKDLLVRFDIRKISEKPGDVSGRIFTVLIPDNISEDQWLVVPPTTLKNGIPSEYKNGQYFSIANFKPIKFRIKNQADPDFFKKASIFIFNEQEDLIFEKLVAISEAQ
ncbi:MAG: hypothetical protein PF690_03775 [Deltaproteobacteria bacterium]|jgi:hypothetical protein|nr:hypothetical protein [Deltaproteobacteria bacterium]